MKKRCLSIGLTALSILMLTLVTVLTRGNVSAAPPPPKVFAGYIPAAVTTGQARLIGRHLGTDQLVLAIGLPLRNKQALTQLLQEVSTPGNAHYGQYLTQTQANQAFNPTVQQEQQAIVWLKSHGLTVTQTYPNHLLVDVTGTFAQIEQTFHVAINDYSMQLNGKSITFYAPANEPTMDASVGNVIYTILGLDDYPSFHLDASLAPTRLASNGSTHGSPPYYPQDFANAYHVNPLWKNGDTGKGQHIGIVLWGPAPSDKTLVQFHQATDATIATRAKTYGPWLNVIPVGRGSYISSEFQPLEAAMDVEVSSAMAPGATIDYYKAPTDKYGNPTTTGLEDALNMAGSDASNNAQISNSWGECEAASSSDPFTLQAEQVFQSNTLTGHDYFFSSGDKGSACVFDLECSYKNPYPQYPASSAFVTSVGGTRFKGYINGGYPGETAWHYTPSTCPNPASAPVGSGGGYSKLFAQPGWQAAFSKNKHRGYPDVAADADPFTGAYICYASSSGSTCTSNGNLLTYGNGTSLAAPLWAGMIADVNQYVQSKNEHPLGFIDPLLYEMHTGMPYAAYHDITKGTNGTYYAGPDWDAVTGLGTPDLYNLTRDAASLGTSAFNGQLNGVASISADDVWAVGASYIDDGSGAYNTLIEHWNGSSWNVVLSPNPGSYGNQLVSVAAVSANDVWAVGYYNDSRAVDQTLIEHFDGTSWTVVPSPNPSSCTSQQGIGACNSLSSVAAVSANDIWAVGTYYDGSNGDNDTLIEHWDGTSWTVVPSPNPSSCTSSSYFCSELSGVAAISTNDVWAVGYYADSNHVVRTLIEHWNGSAWAVVVASTYGSIDLNGVAAVSANDVWAVGDDGSTVQTEHWNGSSWAVVPGPNPTSCGFCSKLSGVAAISTNNVWAVGYHESSSAVVRTLIEHWNGSSWAVVSSPNPNTNGGSLSSVAAVAMNDAWAVGSYQDSNGNSYTLAEHWDGSSWNVVSSP